MSASVKYHNLTQLGIIIDPVIGYKAGLSSGRTQCTSNCQPGSGSYFDAQFSLDLRKMSWIKTKNLQIHVKTKRASNGQYGIKNRFSPADTQRQNNVVTMLLLNVLI